jgi:hypothetical protein
MSRIEEPALGPEASRAEQPEGGLPLPDRIRALVEGELYGVLCTQGGTPRS